MKIRTDFVTNSSSSSFILVQKGEWSEKQKEEIIKAVKNEIMGKKILTPDSTEDEITAVLRENYWDEDEEKIEEIREAFKDGKDIYCGWVGFEGLGLAERRKKGKEEGSNAENPDANLLILFR